MSKTNPTPGFRFKQFTISQTRAAMKVGFDGVLLGAWSDVRGAKRVLDVGTGTGLVALMVAQRTQANQLVVVDAIESDVQAVLDAELNFRESPWRDRLNLVHARFQDWALTTEKSYDLVLCNPPFFAEGNVQDPSRRTARHSVALRIEELLVGSCKLLRPAGRLSVIVPEDQCQSLIDLGTKHGMFPARTLRVRPLPTKPVHRAVVELARFAGSNCEQEIAIEISRHEYTPEYSKLVRDFYLRF